jgi:hypothetical protein
MRRPNVRLLPNTVQHQTGSFTIDAAGGRVFTAVNIGSTIKCSVQPTSADDVPDHLREEAETFYTVYFPDDPGVSIRDLLIWIDPNPDKILYVLGVMNRAGISNTWEVLCGERL